MFEVLCYGIRIPGIRPGSRRKIWRRAEMAWRAAESIGRRLSCHRGRLGPTTVWEDPIEGHKNGKEYLIRASPPILRSTLSSSCWHERPQVRFSATAQDIAAGAGILVDTSTRVEPQKIPKHRKYCYWFSAAGQTHGT